MATAPNEAWFAVRCVLRHPHLGVYEERITLWQAPTSDEAIKLAEHEAREYAEMVGAVDTDLGQAYVLNDEPGHGAEIFSLMRDSSLAADEYLNAFFDTGSEHQQTIECPD